jgi:hypothetical protein
MIFQIKTLLKMLTHHQSAAESDQQHDKQRQQRQ